MAYEPAYQVQLVHHAEVLAARDTGTPDPGRILMLEHDPSVITLTRRPSATANLVATPEALAHAGVTVTQTDRGGDITYHGPGQLIAYIIVDLNELRLGVGEYMRLLEGAVIDTCRAFGVSAARDSCATGVWVPRAGGRTEFPADELQASPSCGAGVNASAKICAMGVRIRRWISMHGLALNITTNLDHFKLIVPCGLAGRPVTSLQKELGAACPPMSQVKRVLGSALTERLIAARRASLEPTRAA